MRKTNPGLSKGEIHMAFESDYAKTEYLEKDNVVFHAGYF